MSEDREYTREEMREACLNNYNAGRQSMIIENERLRGLLMEIMSAPEAAYHGDWFARAAEALPCQEQAPDTNHQMKNGRQDCS